MNTEETKTKKVTTKKTKTPKVRLPNLKRFGREFLNLPGLEGTASISYVFERDENGGDLQIRDCDKTIHLDFYLRTYGRNSDHRTKVRQKSFANLMFKMDTLLQVISHAKSDLIDMFPDDYTNYLKNQEEQP